MNPLSASTPPFPVADLSQEESAFVTCLGHLINHCSRLESTIPVHKLVVSKAITAKILKNKELKPKLVKEWLIAKAKQTADTIKNDYCKAETLSEIANLEATVDLEGAKQTANTIQDAETKAIALREIAKIESSVDLEGAKQT